MNIPNIIVVSNKVELTSRVHTNTKNRLENAGYDQEGHCFHSLHWDSNVSDCFCHDMILKTPEVIEASDMTGLSLECLDLLGNVGVTRRMHCGECHYFFFPYIETPRFCQ